MWERFAVLTALMLCFTGFRAHAEPAANRNGWFPVAGLDFELVDGSDEELRCTVMLERGFRAGYRSRHDRDTWYVASYRDRSSCRAVAGAFKLELGSGLLFGNSGRFFCYAWRRSPPRRHVRIAPSLSMWNRQVGAAFSLDAHGVTAHLALFEKPGGLTEEGCPPAALAAVSSGSRLLRGGAAVLAPLDGRGGADTRPSVPPRLYHFFGSAVVDAVFATGEFDLLADKRYGLIEFGLTAPVRGSVKLFRAPDLKDIGIWEQAARNSCDELSGMVIHAVPGKGAGNPRLQVQSTVRNQNTRRLLRRSCGITLSGKNGRRRSWEVDCTAREECETEYPSSPWASAPAALRSREVRVRSTFRMNDRWYRQVIRTDLLFDRLTWKPHGAATAVEVTISGRGFTITGKIQAYSLRSGNPMALFRPGVGSFESWSLVYGQGSDRCIRARYALHSGATLTLFYGSAWEKSGKIYTAIRWKF